MLTVIVDNGIKRKQRTGFKSSKAAYKWLTPFYLDGYKVTIIGKIKSERQPRRNND